MIKKHWKLLLITSLVILFPILAGVYLWDQLPAQLPIHWNVNGEVDDWAPKGVAVYLLPLLLLGLHWLATIVTAADPKKKNHSPKMLQLVFWPVPVLSLVLSVATYMAALGKELPINLIFSLLLGLIFIVLGCYMPQCKQNYTIGIKLPWTLADEENWNKTHRLAGWVWSIGGLLMMVSGLFDGTRFFLAVVLAIALLPTIYSYILHLKKK